MAARVATHYNSPSIDGTVFGENAVFRGARLADALVYLRSLARTGLRSKREIDAEIGRLIANSSSHR
jgi:hypothetical protein